jgi:hypothetical protein
MKSKPFIITAGKTGQALEPIQPDEKQFPETWLQELLQAHPQILPTDEIEPVFWPLTPIGREVSTNAGYIDNLFISKAGYPVIVETKLWRNTEARREVLAQAIDYASELSKWSFERLDRETHAYHHKGVLELIQSAFDLDPDEVPGEDLVAKNLRLGRFLVLIVSDHIRSSLVEMMSYVNRFPHLATNIGLIELQCYRMPGEQGEIVVVPSIMAKTEIVQRSIVQVNITPELPHQISVEQENVAPDDGKHVLSEESYWERLKQKSPSSVNQAKKIWEHFNNFPEVDLVMRQTAFVARLNHVDSGTRISLFFINTDGTLTCWPVTIGGQIENAGLDRTLAAEYEKALGTVLKYKSQKQSIYSPVEKLDEQAFFQVVDTFIQKVQASENSAED